MTTEKFTTREKLDAMKAYGACSDEVCYAMRRLERIGVPPYNGNETSDVREIYLCALNQAQKNNQMVSVYLNSGEIQGLFVITPGHPSPDPAGAYWNVFKEHAQEKRWDKPIEEQKKEEHFDRFQIYTYAQQLYKKWDVISLEGQYAAERLERQGVEPYSGQYHSLTSELFGSAMKQAKESNNKVGIYLNSGQIRGLFVVDPDAMADNKEYVASRFEHYVKNQQNLRCDKPIAVQLMEERQGKGMVYQA